MLITIEKNDARPLYLQIIIQIKEQVRQGRLNPGDELPSVRELADSLNINMHTVRSAYLKLSEQGIISLRLGRRAAIQRPNKPADKQAAEAEIYARLQELVTDALLMGLAAPDIQRLLRTSVASLENR
jgi:GntR family transcriptional regulator